VLRRRRRREEEGPPRSSLSLLQYAAINEVRGGSDPPLVSQDSEAIGDRQEGFFWFFLTHICFGGFLKIRGTRVAEGCALSAAPGQPKRDKETS
jgi:hypothetical protein